MEVKICSVCKIEKNIDEYHKSSCGSFGRDSRCKTCKRQHRLDNITKFKEYDKKRQIEKKEHISLQKREYVKNNKEKHESYHREYRSNNKDKISEYCKSEDGKRVRREYSSKYYHIKKKFDLKFRLNDRMSGSVRCVLKRTKSGKRWESLVGYKYDDLITRLEGTLPPNKNWNDFLNGDYHIDHIVPLDYFDFNTPYCIDFLLAWRLENLRVMCGSENIKKSNKINLVEQKKLLEEVNFFRRFQDMYRG